MYKYLHSEPINESKTQLAQLFNAVMDRTNTVRLFLAPSSTSIVDCKSVEGLEMEAFYAQEFYNLCLAEIYFHQVIKYLTEWKEMAMQYNDEFAGKWKYYALSKHIELIKEFGGEDEDYNDDGSIRTEFTDEELAHSAIVNEMRDFNDIFLTADYSLLMGIYDILLNNSELDIQKIFSQLGNPIKTYRHGKDGEMIENTWVDEIELSSCRQNECDMLADTLLSAQKAVVKLVKEVKSLKVFTNNTRFFAKLPGRIEAILDLRIDMYEYPRKGGR